eukprot:102982_1
MGAKFTTYISRCAPFADEDDDIDRLIRRQQKKMILQNKLTANNNIIDKISDHPKAPIIDLKTVITEHLPLLNPSKLTVKSTITHSPILSVTHPEPECDDSINMNYNKNATE